MLGAIIGDIVGSRFEFNNIKTKDFEFLHEKCDFTDDTVMTVAIAKALLDCDDFALSGDAAVKNMQDFGRRYALRGYGGRFGSWLWEENPKPYNSFGNGAAMRISPVGFLFKSEFEVKMYAKSVTAVTHNHPQGMKGAEAVAMAIFWAKSGKNKREIYDLAAKNYYPELKGPKASYEYLVEHYGWEYGEGSVTCQSSVPQAFVCFNESKDFEDAIRTAVSIGGDSDTIGAMVGGIAEAHYGIPEDIEKKAFTFLPPELKDIIERFREKMK